MLFQALDPATDFAGQVRQCSAEPVGETGFKFFDFRLQIVSGIGKFFIQRIVFALFLYEIGKSFGRIKILIVEKHQLGKKIHLFVADIALSGGTVIKIFLQQRADLTKLFKTQRQSGKLVGDRGVDRIPQ